MHRPQSISLKILVGDQQGHVEHPANSRPKVRYRGEQVGEDEVDAQQPQYLECR